MSRLYDLWIEMLLYEPLPEQAEWEVVCGSRGLEKLLLYTGEKMKARRMALQVKADGAPGKLICRTGQDPTAVYTLILPKLYGIDENESADAETWAVYRAAFSDAQDWMTAGELLCQMFRIIQAKSPGVYSLKSDMLTLDDGTYMVWKTMHHPEAFFYFDNSYDGRLKALQQCQLDCLDEFDRICKKYKISYFLGGGTLLGAVRHGTIIPWDDDIDVMMLRKDYEQLRQVIADEIQSPFYYQSNRTDADYHSIFDKIRMDGTVFKTEFSQRFEQMHQGIFIDIFVHDRTANSKIGQKIHVFLTLLARSLVFHKWEGTDMHFYGKFKGLCKVMTQYKNHASMQKLEAIQERIVTLYAHKKTKYLYDGTGEHLRHGAFPAEWLDGTRWAKFGEKEYPIPAEAEQYLAYSYGKDYMQMPAPQKRKALHPIVELELPKK